MKNIIVAVDLSDNSGLLINQAVGIAKGRSSCVYLIHVVNSNKDISGRESTEWLNEINKEYSSEVNLLNSLTQTLSDHDIDAHAIIAEGVIVETILDEANKIEAEMIIAGTHNHNAIESLLLGSVSHGIVKHAFCPVLLVPGKQA